MQASFVNDNEQAFHAFTNWNYHIDSVEYCQKVLISSKQVTSHLLILNFALHSALQEAVSANAVAESPTSEYHHHFNRIIFSKIKVISINCCYRHPLSKCVVLFNKIIHRSNRRSEKIVVGQGVSTKTTECLTTLEKLLKLPNIAARIEFVCSNSTAAEAISSEKCLDTHQSAATSDEDTTSAAIADRSSRLHNIFNQIMYSTILSCFMVCGTIVIILILFILFHLPNFTSFVRKSAAKTKQQQQNIAEKCASINKSDQQHLYSYYGIGARNTAYLLTGENMSELLLATPSSVISAVLFIIIVVLLLLLSVLLAKRRSNIAARCSALANLLLRGRTLLVEGMSDYEILFNTADLYICAVHLFYFAVFLSCIVLFEINDKKLEALPKKHSVVKECPPALGVNIFANQCLKVVEGKQLSLVNCIFFLAGTLLSVTFPHILYLGYRGICVELIATFCHKYI